MKVSVVIPSYKDPLLHKTIDGLLDNSGLGNELEVIAVLDGYDSKVAFREDNRIKVVRLGKNRGMREAINAGVDVAKGEYIMRTDEHAMFGDNYDVILMRDCAPHWIVTPRRYFLDVVKWEVMDIPPVDYSKLVTQRIDENTTKWSGQEWKSRARERADIMIDETMAMQGSCWFMKKWWWTEVIGRLESEGYGTHYGDSHEMVFKTWQADGKLMVNKNTWHAHKHRNFPRTHNYGSAEASPGWNYSYNLWKDYYEKEIRPLWKI
jgi:glycosyltransferase involved in cell wall biosynthesis